MYNDRKILNIQWNICIAAAIICVVVGALLHNWGLIALGLLLGAIVIWGEVLFIKSKKKDKIESQKLKEYREKMKKLHNFMLQTKVDK